MYQKYKLTLPHIVDREEVPYLAVQRNVVMPFDAEVGAAVGEVLAHLGAQGASPAGPMFIKYNLIDMPRLEIEIGFPTEGSIAAGDTAVSGVLPAGRYVELVFHGHYDELEGVTAMLLGWASSKGLIFDSEQTDLGERFVCRLELYTNDMATLPSAEWETVLAFKLKD